MQTDTSKRCRTKPTMRFLEIRSNLTDTNYGEVTFTLKTVGKITEIFLVLKV